MTMTIAKEELIKAAGTLKEYCRDHKENYLCDKYTCDLYYGCMEFYDSDMEYAMSHITNWLMK